MHGNWSEPVDCMPSMSNLASVQELQGDAPQSGIHPGRKTQHWSDLQEHSMHMPNNDFETEHRLLQICIASDCTPEPLTNISPQL